MIQHNIINDTRLRMLYIMFSEQDRLIVIILDTHHSEVLSGSFSFGKDLTPEPKLLTQGDNKAGTHVDRSTPY